MIPRKKEKFISLKEATQHCEYSQEYLSLRARQGKLKAVKIGRNWVTKIEWIKDYVVNVEGYKNGVNGKIPEGKVEEKIEQPKIKKAFISRQVPPPDNLPAGELRLRKVTPLYYKILHSQVARFGVTFALTLILILGTAFWGKAPHLI